MVFVLLQNKNKNCDYQSSYLSSARITLEKLEKKEEAVACFL